MLFTKDECFHLIAALETYNDEPRGKLPPDSQNEACLSAIRKLQNINLFTTFTLNERIMLMDSVSYIIHLLSWKGLKVHDILWTLHDKVGSLSLPAESSL